MERPAASLEATVPAMASVEPPSKAFTRGSAVVLGVAAEVGSSHAHSFAQYCKEWGVGKGLLSLVTLPARLPACLPISLNGRPPQALPHLHNHLGSEVHHSQICRAALACSRAMGSARGWEENGAALIWSHLPAHAPLLPHSPAAACSLQLKGVQRPAAAAPQRG